MSKELVKDILLGGLIILSQLLLFRYLKVFGAEADLVLIYLVWIVATRDRFTAIVHAAIMGFALDFFMDTWGLHLIAKTLTIFIVYNLIPKFTDTKLPTWQIFAVILAISFLHNIFFVGIAQFGQIFRVDSYVWIILLGNSFYTALTGSFLYLFKSN